MNIRAQNLISQNYAPAGFPNNSRPEGEPFHLGEEEMAEARAAVAKARKSLNPAPAAPEQARPVGAPAHVTPDRLNALVDKMNQDLAANKQVQIRFDVEEQENDLVVRVVDVNTEKTLRQYPSQQMQSLLRRMKEYQGLVGYNGLLVQETA